MTKKMTGNRPGTTDIKEIPTSVKDIVVTVGRKFGAKRILLGLVVVLFPYLFWEYVERGFQPEMPVLLWIPVTVSLLGTIPFVFVALRQGPRRLMIELGKAVSGYEVDPDSRKRNQLRERIISSAVATFRRQISVTVAPMVWMSRLKKPWQIILLFTGALIDLVAGVVLSIWAFNFLRPFLSVFVKWLSSLEAPYGSIFAFLVRQAEDPLRLLMVVVVLFIVSFYGILWLLEINQPGDESRMFGFPVTMMILVGLVRAILFLYTQYLILVIFILDAVVNRGIARFRMVPFTIDPTFTSQLVTEASQRVSSESALSVFCSQKELVEALPRREDEKGTAYRRRAEIDTLEVWTKTRQFMIFGFLGERCVIYFFGRLSNHIREIRGYYSKSEHHLFDQFAAFGKTARAKQRELFIENALRPSMPLSDLASVLTRHKGNESLLGQRDMERVAKRGAGSC